MNSALIVKKEHSHSLEIRPELPRFHCTWCGRGFLLGRLLLDFRITTANSGSVSCVFDAVFPIFKRNLTQMFCPSTLATSKWPIALTTHNNKRPLKTKQELDTAKRSDYIKTQRYYGTLWRKIVLLAFSVVATFAVKLGFTVLHQVGKQSHCLCLLLYESYTVITKDASDYEK